MPTSMSEAAWDDSHVIMNGGRTMSVRHHTQGVRSQDDAMVGYFFQRPQNDPAPQYSKRWAVGDDSRIEQVRGISVVDLERDFQNMSTFERDPVAIGPTAKKLWDIPDQEEAAHKQNEKGIFSGANPWMPRDDAWSAASESFDDPRAPRPQHWNKHKQHFHEHAISQPISVVQRRPGSFPSSEANNVLSPRSSEAGALGVNMVEYVLGGSPSGKEIDRLRMKQYVNVHGHGDDKNGKMPKDVKSQSPFEGGDQQVKEQEAINGANGMMQNGVDGYGFQTGSRQNSPTEEEKIQHMQMQEAQRYNMSMGQDDRMEQPQLIQPGLHLDAPQFEPVGIDTIPFDYNNQLMPSMDSPNFGGLDYNQQHQLLQRQQQQQQPIAVLTQQQYVAAQQQLGLAQQTNSLPYVMNSNQQEPYSVGIPLAGPTAVMPPYYGVQTPWGIYPANIIQQQGQQMSQQQLMRGQQGRPLTPSQSELGTPGGGVQQLQAQDFIPGATAGYQILAAPAYYDQNGQLVMGNARGIGTPVRLVSPAPLLVSSQGQQGASPNGIGNSLRLLAGHVAPNSPVAFSSNNSAYTPNSNMNYTPVSSSLLTPNNNTGFGQQQTGFGSSLGTLGGSTNTPGTIGSGASLSQRRDSLTDYKLSDYKMGDYKRQVPLTQYYNTLGGSTLGGAAGSPAGPMGLVQPAQSLTPPPSLSGSSSNLSLGGIGGGTRGYSAAPGAEAKYHRSGLANNQLFGTSIFNTRNLARSASLSKEVTVGRSRMLEDFRNNRIPNLQLKDLVNHVVEFSQDQHGSRFIQQKLERATPAEKVMVFNEILTAAYSLMTDVFGNYVIQKFFEFGSPDQKQTLAQRVRGHVLPLALQMYGCRVIQKALESIPADMQVEIVKELDGHVLKCVKDQNGNHVVQKCIECVDPKHLQFIIDAFNGQVFTLSTHPYGCRVIQRILEHCTPDQTIPILDELHENTERLVQDQYGNYVIQHVLEHGRPDDKSRIVAILRGKVLHLSQHKFASNVVEKCVSHSSRAEKAMLIDEVCSMNEGALYTMMKDQFANYVVQKMIDVAEPAQRKILMHKIRPHVATLRKYTYGKHILAKLEKFFMKNTDLGPIGMPPNGALQ
ncbi:pumilio homolog 2-like isoform X4 [Lineus longissimus]|uniref:pumilio homolog 2-like isoform X4 n=1 Tax=Lineus longissimus TaxID=88925 RepID=UPI00315D0AB4